MASTSSASTRDDCFICQSSLSDGVVNHVKARGVARLLECSVKRKKRDDERLLCGVQDIRVHAACQKNYTNEKLIQAYLVRATHVPTTVTRALVTSFDFNDRCFFCDEYITTEYRVLQGKLPYARRNYPVKVTLPGMAIKILAAAQRRGDALGQKIHDRISQLAQMNTDLVAVNAEYHEQCLASFYKLTTGERPKGRPQSSGVDEAMEVIFKYLNDNSDECQFSVPQLENLIDEESRPRRETIKNRLVKKYGENIIFTETGKGSIACLKSTSQKILSDSWYSDKKSDERSERLRVVEAAGNIILEDIRTKVFNTVDYPPMDAFLSNAQSVIPETLLLLLHTIILTNKRGSLDAWKRKCLALAHAIMLATRPKSFLSSIMIAVGVYIYKKFGSKHLLNLLAALGLSATYEEANRLEGSLVLQSEKTTITKKPRPFVQCVFDNADFNVNTLDGHDTFHAMGGIMAVTPREAVVSELTVSRLRLRSSSKLIAEAGSVQLVPYHRPVNGGLKTVKVVDAHIDPAREIVPSADDIAWLYGKNSGFSQSVPGWNGFMELGTRSDEYQCSKIVCLPFINAPPGDYSTLFTSILAALDQCKAVGQKTCIVTFDQPLFWKAREVVADQSIPEMRNVVVRLGGFHLLMSFMGAMGSIMEGSGLKELFTTIYAGNSVEKILSGHAYARAVRAHILSHSALAGLIFERLDLDAQDLEALNNVVNSPDRSIILRANGDEAFRRVSVKFAAMLKTIESEGPTAALWIQYFRMCTLMKNFIKAERMGDWELHLETVKEMIPFFHAAGHLNYAKSSHLYYQDMMNLNEKMDPQELTSFTTQGYFTIRRSDKFWSGIWSDMTIEQVLMRAMKSYGGLTRGRGVSDCVLARWTLGMLCLQEVCEQIEVFTEVETATSEQHVDMRPTRVKRDNQDKQKLADWLSQHQPFVPIKELISLSTGAIGHDKVNCHLARDIGITSMKNMVGESYESVKLKRKDKVTTLASVYSTLKIANKKISVDPLTLFQRVCISKRSDDDLKDLFKYELAPFPMSLFTEEGLRKGTKSSLYSVFTPQENAELGSNVSAVIDGGFLLHKVVWLKSPTTTFGMLCANYVDYVLRHFGTNATVVFDGYPTDLVYQSTKAAERCRRALQQHSTKFTFNSSTNVTMAQDKFLSNDFNKKNFISMVMTELEANGIEACQAVEDADVLIVNTAIEKAPLYDDVVVTAEDIDILVLLSALGSSVKNVWFQKSGRGNAPSIMYSPASCQFQPEEILFLHAVSGCDTTSAPFGLGKRKVCRTYAKNLSLKPNVATFANPHATPSEICEAGENILVALYGGTSGENLDDLRFSLFTKSVAKAKSQLARLPPTGDAARYHSYRTYQQVQTWLGNHKIPSVWGWSLTDRGVIPITTTKNAAPDSLLKILACKCAKGCISTACSCKKAGLRCSVVCKHCSGHACENSRDPDLNEDDEEEQVDEQDLLQELIAQEEEELENDDPEPLPKRSRHD